MQKDSIAFTMPAAELPAFVSALQERIRSAIGDIHGLELHQSTDGLTIVLMSQLPRELYAARVKALDLVESLGRERGVQVTVASPAQLKGDTLVLVSYKGDPRLRDRPAVTLGIDPGDASASGVADVLKSALSHEQLRFRVVEAAGRGVLQRVPGEAEEWHL